MAARNNGNVRAYKKPINLNIGMIFFAVILIYIIICVYMFFSQKQIYGYEVKRLNQQVKRNISRFPEDFMFQLTEREVEELRLQNVTANINSIEVVCN